MSNSPFALIGVNSDDLPRAKKAIKENGLNWRSFQNTVEGQPTISKEWCVKGWPTVVVLDEEMRIHYRGHDGHEATDIAKKLVEKLAAKKGE